MPGRLVTTMVVGMALVVTAVSVVYVKHRSRTLFVELQSLERDRDRLNVEWTQLTLENTAWATHDRIEQVASKQLSFRMPTPADMEVMDPY
tara:strand:+ start:72 stop:344 length:273 start_codon:yes stop_codon:yes gene_type:complete